jgi:addiction module RelB/DinJ family antitoxin
MTKTLQLRVDESLRREADSLFTELGLDTTTAVRMFLRRAVQTRSIPFALRIEEGPAELIDVPAPVQAQMDQIGALWAKKRAKSA